MGYPLLFLWLFPSLALYCHVIIRLLCCSLKVDFLRQAEVFIIVIIIVLLVGFVVVVVGIVSLLVVGHCKQPIVQEASIDMDCNEPSCGCLQEKGSAGEALDFIVAVRKQLFEIINLVTIKIMVRKIDKDNQICVILKAVVTKLFTHEDQFVHAFIIQGSNIFLAGKDVYLHVVGIEFVVHAGG